MKRIGAVLAITFIMFASGAALAGDGDSTASQNGLIRVGELSIGLVDSTQPPFEDTLAQGVIGERRVWDRLILPALVTAAVGGLLILLFTQRG